VKKAALLSAIVLCLGLAAPSGGVFRDVTKTSGVSMKVASDLRKLKLIATMIGGVAMGDYDGDGRPDLYVTNSISSWGKPNKDHCGRLYQNVGGRFEDVTAKAGIRACGLGMGAFWADLDGDGRLDLYLTNVGANTVWWNRGDGTFEEGKDTGLEDPLFSVGAAFLDYDADGRLDVVVANYLDSTPEWEASQPQFELRIPENYVGQPSHLYRNLGGRKFANVTAEAGLAMPPAETKTLGIAVLDYDGDGKPDLYFVNDRTSNRLFRNRGDGKFEETTAETGTGRSGDLPPRAGMGVAIGDPFGTGRDSLFVTNFGAEENSLFRNVEGALFEDSGTTSGAGAIGLPYVRWGTHFADFDNDGWTDLYAAGGHLAPRIVRTLGRYRKGTQAAYVEAGDRAFAQKTVLLHNLGEGRFVEWDSGDLGKRPMSARGTAVADIDGDGALDLVVVDIDGPVRVFRNVLPARHWIAIEPRPAPGDSRPVLGARVTVTAGDRAQTQPYWVSPSYASGSLVPLHFGLGEADAAEVEIVWPGGEKQSLGRLGGGKTYRVPRGGEPEDMIPGGTKQP
jgi:enediyne biosynthesis protein E4